jgi:hypothetical protein
MCYSVFIVNPEYLDALPKAPKVIYFYFGPDTLYINAGIVLHGSSLVFSMPIP